MADYNLDSLGWLQFERLVQALLKAELGVGVEAWGGPGDFGRDAYSNDALPFPSKERSHPGPFVFQAKFISGANGPGARPRQAIEDAVRREAVRIKDRVESRAWKTPKHYALFTNAPVTAATRETVHGILSPLLPTTDISSQGAGDIDALLDSNGQVRLSYPQILGVRDLTGLLKKVVHSDIISRSTLQLDLSNELAQVFVPTSAYQQALQALRDSGMALLSGPPEVGKTAIARMLALSHLTTGRMAYECTTPSDLLRLMDSKESQIFVADDAFGSTEYSPALGDEWAREMERVLSAIDKRHWVVWTSRTAPLQEALRRLNFQGRASRFPQPSQVVVNASQLAMTEKALILYRHARASGLGGDALRFIKANAKTIVRSDDFTPLRIQRLIQADIPTIMNEAPTDRYGALMTAISQGLRQPTRAMQTSFLGLDPHHRRLLIAMLDASERDPTVPELLDAAHRHEIGGAGLPPEAVLASLDEHFVSVRVKHAY